MSDFSTLSSSSTTSPTKDNQSLPNSSSSPTSTSSTAPSSPGSDSDVSSLSIQEIQKDNDKKEKEGNNSNNIVYSEEDIQRSLLCKEKGNKALLANKFKEALEAYSEGIEIQPTPILYSNRALVYIKLEMFGQAIQDADDSISLDPKYIKAFYRRGSANFSLAKYKNALRDFKLVVKLVPNDKDAKKKLKECESVVKAIAFAEALKSDELAPASETMLASLKNIRVDNTKYDGPHLENVNEETGEFDITEDFVNSMLERFKEGKSIHRKYICCILLKALKLFRELPNIVRVYTDDSNNREITVCGDTHGQFYDVMHIFNLNGKPSPSNPYVFNGDFVDRGSWSLEVILTFFAYKCLYPDDMYMTRGNHESKTMNRIYGFEGEVKHKVDEPVMNLFSEVFCALPLGYIINDKVFIVHGGLFSEDNVTIADINALNRFREPPESGIMSDILWSDPQILPGRAPNKRGVGQAFGPDITKKFLDLNNLELLVRSHEVKDDGYEVMHDGKCITIFSAPNYCDQMGNKAAYIRFKDDCKPNFTQFSAVEHPPIKPMAYANTGSFMGF